MRKLLLLSPAVLLFFSCTSPSSTKTPVGLLSTDSLAIQNFIININADTLLHTSNGSWIKIDKETFSSDNGKVVLEVKEALTMEQIIKAGLITTANGQPLASGGMIYINAAAGQKVTINKPFKVAVPSTSLDKNMQLFKGKETKDGKINWESPKALTENKQMTVIKKGEVLFQQKCASCHDIGKEGSGPDLANVWKRINQFEGEGDAGWDHNFRKVYVSRYESKISNEGGGFTHTVDSFVHPASPYVCNLIRLFNNQEIDLSTDVSKNPEDWMKIIQYIENESNRRSLPYPPHAYLDSCIDSCNLYQRIKEEIEQKRSAAETKRKELIKKNGSMVERKTEQVIPQNNSVPPPGFVNTPLNAKAKVTPEDYTATYYEFTVETFGWYNIDVLLKQDDNIKQSELFVRLVGSYRERIKLYLIIPGMRIMLDGGATGRNKDEYAFYNKDGTIPLPQNINAYILAFTETDKSIAYSIKKFVPELRQTFDISLTESSKQEFSVAIANIGTSGLNIEVNKSKNSAAIQETDKTIQELQEELKKAENMKPTRCDCDCGQPSIVDAGSTQPTQK